MLLWMWQNRQKLTLINGDAENNAGLQPLDIEECNQV